MHRFIKDSRGATAIEYGLIAGLIAVSGIASMALVGTKLGSQFNTVSTKLNVQ